MGKSGLEEDEEAFPRGRAAADPGADRDDSAGDQAQPQGDKTQGKKRSRGGAKKAAAAAGNDEEEDAAEPSTLAPGGEAPRNASRLRPFDLAEGTLLVCAVREVHEDELTLNLPFNLHGFVSRAQATELGEPAERLPPLPEAYPVGRLVVAVVTAVVEVGKGKKHRIEMSLRPSLANAGLTAEDIVPHMWLPALVQSEEEHVFRLSFGVGLEGLMKKTEASTLPGGVKAVKPGMIIQVGVQSAGATIQCSGKPSGSSLGAAPVKLGALKAGFIVHARVDKVLEQASAKGKEVSIGANNGVVVSFCGALNGVMHWHHQGDDGGLKYKQRVQARVLAVVPGPQVLVHMTLMPHILDWTSKAEDLFSLPIGDRLDGTPLELLPKYGCRFNCALQGSDTEAPVLAFCPTNRMGEEPSGDPDDDTPPAPKLSSGQKTECRVLSYNFLDATVIVTRRPNDLKESTLVSPLELTPGQPVVGEITRICEYGVFVKLSDFITALVHLRQLTDVPLAKVPDRFQVGTKLKCRVLRVIAERCQVALTSKKSLMKSPFQLADFKQVRKDMLVTGYVSNVKDYGAIVHFYGDAFGLIPAKEMTKQEAPALGMAVKVRINEINQQRRRFALSLDLTNGKDPIESQGTAMADDVDHSPAVPGDIASAAVVVDTLAEGLVIEFSTKKSGGGKLRGFVPLNHLSDDLEQAKARHAMLSAALATKSTTSSPDLGDGVVLAKRFQQGPRDAAQEGAAMVLVSLKPTLRLAAQEGTFITEFSQLQAAKLYTGYIKHILDGGVLVSFGGWRMAGMAPKHQLADKYVENPSEEFQQGQTVRALLVKIDMEKQRFSVNLSKINATSSDAMLLRREAEALSAYFTMQASLAPATPSSTLLLPGSVIDATVTSVKPYGVLLSLDAHAGLTGLALKENGATKVKEGQQLRCCVLDFDAKSKIADVSLQSELVAAAGGAWGKGLKPPTSLPEPEPQGKKRKKKAALEAGETSSTVNADGAQQEVQVQLALQKPAYSVFWSSSPPAVVFAPPWDRHSSRDPRPSLVYSVPEKPGFFSRLLVRSPHGGGERVGRSKISKIQRPGEELQVGSPMTMRVVSVKGLEVFCASPVGIRGHVHATHFLDLGDLGAGGESPVPKIKKKDVLEARVLHIQNRDKLWHLELTCRPTMLKPQDANIYEEARIRWPGLKPGKQVSVVVETVRKNFVWVEVAPGIKGQISALNATKDPNIMKALDKHFEPGQVFTAEVLRAVTSKKYLDLILHGTAVGPAPLGRTLARLEKVEDVSRGGLAATFRLPSNRRAFVHVTELYDFWAEFPLKRLRPGSMYEAHVLRGDAEDGTGRAEISLRASLVHGQAEGPAEARALTAGSLKLGQKVSGYVVNSSEKGVFVAVSRSLVGRIKLKALSDQVVLKENVASLYKTGELIRQATVTDIDEKNNRVELSLRKTDKGGRLTVEQLSVGDTVSGRVKAVAKYGIFVRIDNSSVDGLVHRDQISDTASVSIDSYSAGSIVPRVKVLKIEDGKLWLGLKSSLFEAGDGDDDDDDDDADLNALLNEAGKDEEEKAGGADLDEDMAGHEEEDDEEPAPKKAKKEEKKDAKKVAPAKAEEEDDDDLAPWEQAAAKTAATLAEADTDAGFDFADFQATVESASEAEASDDAADGEADGKESLTKRQKKAAKLADTKEVQQLEADNAEGRSANDPRSVEDFERLLLTQGNTSIVWIRYMAFHLKMSDLERARQVAERAVKHVGFAEGKERFNVWVAFMNLECTFGTEQTADAAFRRAVSHNDAKQVHLQLARIHERNHKLDLAAKAYEACGKKFPQSKKVWLAQLSCLYRQGNLEAGRKALPKCLAVLPRKKHALVVSKAALLEYQYGSAERGRSVFEGLLDSYPKRTDLWSIYIDAHIKAHTPPKVAKADLAEVRSLLERCSVMKLKATKMRFFFKRWLDFEKRYGDAESQELVRNKARAFVESQAT